MVSNKKDFLGEIPASTMETTKEKKANADIEGEDECVQVLDSFSQNTTAHGFKYAASKERNKFVRCLWCFAIAVATFTLIWTLLTNKAKLEKYPTRTVVDVKYVKELPFPAVTICNLNEFDYRKADNLTNVVNGAQKVFNLYLAGTFLAHTDLETYLKDPEYEDVLNVAIDEVYHEVFPQINETFLHCEWKGVTHSCESIFRPVYTFDGMCYQFNGNASNPLVTSAVGPMNGLTVVMDINQAGYVVESMLSAGGKLLLFSNHQPYNYLYVTNFSSGVMIFAVLAVLVLSATATPCTDTCNGYCGGVKQVCDLTGLLGPLCDTSFNICALGCGVICGCVDKCFAECSTKLNECNAAGSINPLALATCDVNFANCQSVCGTQCAVETTTGVINQALGGGGAK